MVEATNNKVELGSALKLLLFFFAFIYPFVLENGRMSESVDSYALVHILPIPKAVRYVEILFYVATAIYIFLLAFPATNKFFSWKDLSVIALSFIIGFFVFLLDEKFRSGNIGVRIQVTWLLVAPYLIFFIFYFFKFSDRFFNTCINAFFGIGIVNSLVGVFQFQALHLIGDDVNGAMQDAHTFGNTMLLVILGFIILKRLRKYFFLIIFPLIAFVGASSQKSYVVLLLLLLIYIFFFAALKTKLVIGLVVIVFGSFFINFVIQNDPQILERFVLLVDFGIRNSGIGQSYADIIEIHNRYIYSYPFGLGIGNYANPINYPSFLGDVDIPVSALFREKMTNYGVISAFDMQITYIGFLLVEVGFIGFFIISKFYYRILRSLLRLYRERKTDMALFGFFGLLIAIMSAFFTLLYSMEQISLIYPLMALAGMLCQKDGETVEYAIADDNHTKI